MANTWILYKNSEIIPEKNFKVDSLEDYLLTLSKTTITNCQYIKHDLSLIVKLNLDQQNLDFFEDSYNINYMSILNNDDSSGLPVYYFITKKTWISEKTVALTLVMDTINTFTEARNSFVWSDRTLVNREHKDRFVIKNKEYKTTSLENILKGYTYFLDPTSWTIFGSATIISEEGFFMRKENRSTGVTEAELINELRFVGAPNFQLRIYKYEGDTHTLIETLRPSSYSTLTQTYSFVLSNPFTITNEEIMCKNFSGYLINKRYNRAIDLYSEGLTPVLFKKDLFTIKDDDLDWYLIYKNQNDPSEVLTNPVNCFLCADKTIEVETRTLSWDLTDIDDNTDYILLAVESPNSTVFYKKGGKTYSFSNTAGRKIYNVIFTKENRKVNLRKYETTLQEDFVLTERGQVNVELIPDVSEIIIDGANNVYIASGDNYPVDASTNVRDVLYYPSEATTGQTSRVTSIETLDRTDAKLIKIIKLPYCPVIHKGNILGDGEWLYDASEEKLKLSNLNNKFENSVYVDDYTNPFVDLYLSQSYFNHATTETLKNVAYESKLLHSDYHQIKFIYDSFSFVFQLERMNIPDFIASFNFKFVTTSTINSRFLFAFTQYESTEYGSQDYNNILAIARNNEVTIYNQQYMNYLRAGYNYDVKSKTRQEAASIIGTGLSLVGAVASFASTPATGGIGVASGISFLTGAAGGIVSTVNTVAQAEQNMEAKQAQLKNQSTSVAGADDVDLMSYYANNKAKLSLYKVSPKMKKALWDMFYYTGYVSGEMKIPDRTSRVWFNFVACEPQFEKIYNIPNNCLEDLKERYKGGVTIMHKHNNKWNWGRTYENWETSLNIRDPQ